MLLGNLAAKIRETRQTECENKKGDNAEKSVVECVEPPDQVETISEPTEVECTESETTDKEKHVPERTIVAAPTIQEPDSREKELDEDINEPSEIQNIAVAPTIEIHQSAWTLACCYLWLTSKNMNERKGVMFNTPRPFQELANKNFLLEVPDQAEWITWNRIHGCVLDNFLVSKENIKGYKQAFKEVMCLTPHWWREKYLANSELSTK